MSETASLRVKVRKEYLPFYKDLIRKKIFKEHNEFFTFCCSIGKDRYDENRQIPLVELCHAYTFKEDQQTVLRTLVFSKTSTLYAERELFAIAEMMADAGFNILMETVLSDLVIIHEGDLSLKPGMERDVQLALSKYTNEVLNVVPF
ncbi:hypothetical protein SH601_15090 [Gracilibacillus sp. S3-1-1]|uniref:Uncharacterized protein n=1 Tax=Gracilibacillus pellucidus TaxID=3095368 RepID=A0ACC6M8M5_9BACI|nr:hypothetical protein [Gracilibacillus sp. S3-1-1]MDX8047294.1 hypothetical protein [Gracilibacillus sp. S3-1-1]